jgi:tRNA-specific 2-thiouridylase
LRSRDEAKDQSYVLYMLGQEELAAAVFPLGELSGKAETRQMARDLGLEVADKPDSQEICFVGEPGGYAEFLRGQQAALTQPGELVDEAGRVLGEHQGIAGLTVGQRRGLGVSAKSGRPLYVIRLEPQSNRAVLGEADSLLAKTVFLDEMVWHVDGVAPVPVTAKIRYNMPAAAATLIPGPRPKLVFRQPVRAAAPGQIAVAYVGKTVVAGGKIAGSSRD